MSAPSFYLGVFLVVVAAALAWYFARCLRQRVMPDWEGSPGVVVEIILALSLVVVVSQLLGSAGLLESWALIVSLGLVALIAGFILDPAGQGEGGAMRVPTGQVPRWGSFLALGVTAILVGQWASFASNSLDFGILNFDSVWYHLPFSAEMARTGSVLDYLRTETVFVNWFYPQNSELLHAVPMVLTGRDFFSVLINFGWLGLALVAAWGIGRPWGRSHLTLIGAAVVLVSSTMVIREPGMAKNDIVAVALMLASVAILLNIGRNPGDTAAGGRASKDHRAELLTPGWPVAIAGLAAGLAVGTKYTVLAPLVFISVAVFFAAVPGARFKVLGRWLAGTVVGGGFWYLRNLLVTGNPVPQVMQLGPIDLPGPDRLQEARPDFSVAHYLTDWSVWSEYFIPGLDKALGPLWPAIIVVLFFGPLILAFKGDRRLVRGLALATLAAAVAYIFTPLGASGEEGRPVGFVINLRFLAPALALALATTALLPVFSRPRAQVAFAVVAVALFLTAGRLDALYELSGRYFGLTAASFFIILPGLVWLFTDRVRVRARIRGLAVGIVALLALAAAWPIADSYFENRYRDFESQNGLAAPYRWANETRDSAVGLAGTVAGFRQYGFFGPDLSNRVVYIGRESPAGGLQVIDDCPAFMEEVQRSGIEYLVTSPFLNFESPDRPIPSPETGWVEGDDAFEPVVRGPVAVWSLRARPDPESCGDPDPVPVPGLKDG